MSLFRRSRKKEQNRADKILEESKKQLDEVRAQREGVRAEAEKVKKHIRDNHLAPAIRKALGG